MTVDIWYRMIVGDFMKKTDDLSPAEVGAYIRICNRYWANQGKIPDDDEKLRRIVGATEKEWPKLRKSIAHLFLIQNGYWVLPAMDAEIRNAQEVSAKRKAAGKLGADARWHQVGEA